ncbi:MAG: ABC transporter ATP-binding protein [Acidobacteriota bacterium]
MSGLAIRTRGLSRRFGEVLAVDALNLEVPAGAVTGFLGPNGAGKTTALRLILGLIRPDAGRVELFGESLAARREALLGRVGALVETPSLYPHLTGRENLEATRRILGLDHRRVEQVLEVVRLQDAAHRLVGEYSLGMRQRLGLGLALLPEPRLLILDEPTNGLDPAGIQEMRRLVRRLPQAEGVSVFLSSHLLAEVEQVASHLAILDRGRCLFQGPTADLSAQRQGGVVVGVERAVEAAALLVSAGWACEVVDGEVRVATQGRAARGEICRQLVEAGFAVHRLDETSASLEAAFLELTEVGSFAGGGSVGGGFAGGGSAGGEKR